MFALLLGGYGLSGLCAMVYQVGWARVLALALSNSTYALALILTAYIGGLALGGLLMTPAVDRLKRPLLWAAGLEFLIGLSALAVIPLFEWVTGRMFLWSLSLLHRFTAYQAVRFAVAFGLIFLPTFAMGALFPVVVKLAGSGRRGVGEPAGQVYAANTLGAIVGAFLAGQVLIAWLGVEKTLLLATGLSVAVGVIWFLSTGLSLRWRLAVAGGLAALAALTIWRIPAWDPLLMNSGPFLYSQYYEKQLRQGVSVHDILNDNRLLFHREGLEATVSVLETRDTAEKILRINGKADASSRQDMPTQVLSTHIPLLLHPQPKKMMVLGLASGVSAGSALLHPIERLDCVEIAPEVAAASHYFEAISRLNYQDPRFHLILDDARNFLALSDVRYDVITIESTNPWIAGLGALYTREFFQLLADHLEPGGLALIFIPFYDMDPDTVRLVLRTYRAVFPYTVLWESIPAVDYLVVGSRQPIQVDGKQWQARAAAPAIAEDLARVGVRSADLLAAFVMGSVRLAQVAGTGPLDTDDRRRLEFVLPPLMAQRQAPRQTAIVKQVLAQHEPASVIVSGADRQETDRLIGFDRARTLYYQAFAMSSFERLDETGLQRIIQAWEDAFEAGRDSYLAGFAGRELASPLVARGKLRLSRGHEAGALADWEKAFQLDPSNYASSDQLLDYYQDQGDAEKLRAWAERALRVLPRDAYALEVLGQMEQEADHLPAAEQHYRLALEVSPQAAKFRWNLAVVLAMQKKFFQAEQEFRALVESDPQNPDYLLALAYALKDQGRKDEADRYWKRAKKLAPQHPLFQHLQDE
jgi:spermidine synthase